MVEMKRYLHSHLMSKRDFLCMWNICILRLAALATKSMAAGSSYQHHRYMYYIIHAKCIIYNAMYYTVLYYA